MTPQQREAATEVALNIEDMVEVLRTLTADVESWPKCATIADTMQVAIKQLQQAAEALRRRIE